MDGAQMASIAISRHRARASASFRRETKVFEGGIQSGLNYMITLDGVIGSRGGIPPIEGGKVIGAIGVSGHGVEDDHIVAEAPAHQVAAHLLPEGRLVEGAVAPEALPSGVEGECRVIGAGTSQDRVDLVPVHPLLAQLPAEGLGGARAERRSALHPQGGEAGVVEQPLRRQRLHSRVDRQGVEPGLGEATAHLRLAARAMRQVAIRQGQGGGQRGSGP